jgi:hypothetical protein
MKETPIYLASILLEPNRWKAGKEPSYEVSAWLDKIRAAGFDGIELWENHYLKASSDEQEALRGASVPIRLFNTYAAFTATGGADEDARRKAADATAALKAGAVKFNAGNDPKRTTEYLETAVQWARLLPPNTRLICECHPGTVLETPEAAEKAFHEHWRDERFQAIVHPFSTPLPVLKEWMKRLSFTAMSNCAGSRTGPFAWTANPARCGTRWRSCGTAAFPAPSRWSSRKGRVRRMTAPKSFSRTRCPT